ncbi:MAG TPA: zeta toxin family protein [Xanthobacteraceae bacterium]|nr:zeta toxin family protein [Xanthobacteraceae bacterium]
MAEKAEELFYLDDDGARQDAEIHETILARNRVDEKIMAPIRDRHRDAYLAQQQAKARGVRWLRIKQQAQRRIWNEADHPREPAGSEEGGQFAGGAGDLTSASALREDEETATPDEIIDRVPGAREQIADVRAKLKQAVPTSAPVSKGGHKRDNGSWTPERAAVHRDVVSQIMTPEAMAAARPAQGEQPVLHILGGRGGSGKSWYTGPDGTIDKSKSLYLNNDDVKERLPEYQGWNAAVLHEESSYVGGVMETYARDNKMNVIIDATLKDGLTTAKRIEAFKAAGYRIEGHYMYTSPAKAAERALGRFVRGMEKNGKGRFVPPEYSLGSTTNEQSFDRHRDDMDFWEIYDNDGDAPKLHAKK